ncbi:MAG: DEAD/DEAH box helicase, partial [Selenomonadaceae bacterium]|nr:DEAD/DEAH box helicase [Selenomonadaceae bacterium]
GKILFLVPSISLLSQTLEEWATFSVKPLNAICVCSDETASQFDDEITDVNLPLPALTDAKKISDALKNFPADRLTVIFSTYQSIEVINKLKLEFDLVICDEAHRTAVAVDEMQRLELSAKKNSALGEHSVFTAVHDENFIRAKKRMYMTATPKLFKTDAKDYAKENDLTLWSMDDEKIFGEKFFTITFAQAKDGGYLADYKVLIFTVDETALTPGLRRAVNDKKEALTFDNTLKIVGCINALSKKLDKKSARLVADDTNTFMHTAVAFCKSINEAESFAKDFPNVQEKYFAEMDDDERNSFVNVSADFVFGSRKIRNKSYAMTSAQRSAKLQKLKTTPLDGNACTVLHNVRCLSEGVDVPALDAIIFLASKRSEVEIVQAVGRVMRLADHKKFGYIIIPVVVPMSNSAEDALDRNAEFKEVWRIINALRSHDEDLRTEIERIRKRLESNSPETGDNLSEKVIIGVVDQKEPVQLSLGFFLRWEDFKDKIYARMVEHVGDKLYWISWAYKVADIVERHTRRISELVSVEGEHKRAFDEFVDGLRKNINPNVTEAEVIDMLAQHLVTRPVFEGLFENYNFVAANPVSKAMQKILDVLEGEGITKDRQVFAALYKQVSEECSGMGDAESRQRIIVRLYDSFFRIALKKTAERLGIVYTPVEVVDFILRSVDAVLKKNFNRGLSDKNVHVLDPFAGTGTFITRLIESDLINAEDLPRKFLHELHANEIVLLAYYIAAINIENSFAAAHDKIYRPFEGICFTDTFQLYERGQQSIKLAGVMQENSERVNSQQAARIEVIVGNPPYSVGQRSANDNNQNQT